LVKKAQEILGIIKVVGEWIESGKLEGKEARKI
jgi:hypothetical protein